MNRPTPIWLQDNAIPGITKMTLLNVQQLELKVLHYPICSPDLVATDYRFFLNFNSFFTEIKVYSYNAIKQVFQDCHVFSFDQDKLLLKWQICIGNICTNSNE